MPKDILKSKKKKSEEVFEDLQGILRAKLQFILLPEKTYLYAVIVDKTNQKNKPTRLHCKSCNAFSGYAYDAVTDSVLVNCVAFAELGQINCSIKASFDNVGNWMMYVPLPCEAVDLLMSASQKKTLKQLTSEYDSSAYETHFVQMISCN